MNERKIRSVPPLLGISVSIDGLFLGELGQRNSGQNPENFVVRDHTFRKPTKEKPTKPLTFLEAKKITWGVEVHEDYDTKGRLGVILEFSGIVFPIAPVFEKSKIYYGHDSRVYFSRIGCKNRLAFLILATYGDLLEAQVVPRKINESPFFREEIHLPQLTVTHDPTSMTVDEKNHLVVVSYK